MRVRTGKQKRVDVKYYKETGKDLKRIKHYNFWQDGNHVKEIYSHKFFEKN
jgi:hypothetical protein